MGGEVVSLSCCALGVARGKADELDASSRPKNLSEVSAQDHTVAVLKKTLESANVSSELSSWRRVLTTASAASSHALLRTPWHRKDLDDPRPLQAALRPRALQVSCTRAQRLR